MKRILGIAALAFLVSYHANAQHEYHNRQDTTKPETQIPDTSKVVVALP